jgi:two-component system chemotaxis response regulator CheB
MTPFFPSTSDEDLGDQADVYRVMIVDDSAFIRGAISRALEGDPALIIAASVSNGDMAIKALTRNPVDVIVLDIEMPVMDGLTALPKLKEIDPAVQVIMASTLTQKNAEISLRAMSLGATDYIPKPSTGHEVMNADEFKRELVAKVKALGALARRSGVRMPIETARTARPTTAAPAAKTPVAATAKPLEKKPFDKQTPAETPRFVRSVPSPSTLQKKEVVLRKEPIQRPDIIAIGSSTGGPQALFRVLKDMGPGLPQPVVITQHMPPAFTSILADHITRQCHVPCIEAKAGDVLEAGHYYVAPGDFHMLIDSQGQGYTVRLVKDPPENFCRPSVDPMLRSLVPHFGKRILTVILTGMGQDGMRGGELIVKAGGSVIAQDEPTSVVWGMPGAVAMAGLCSAVLPIGDIGGFVRQNAMRPRT